jgi:hypothetical protein
MSTLILPQKERVQQEQTKERAKHKTQQQREYVTVNVNRDIHKQLCKAGEKGMTFSQIIQNLLDARNERIGVGK